jgi:hypothetical protein
LSLLALVKETIYKHPSDSRFQVVLLGTAGGRAMEQQFWGVCTIRRRSITLTSEWLIYKIAQMNLTGQRDKPLGSVDGPIVAGQALCDNKFVVTLMSEHIKNLQVEC